MKRRYTHGLLADHSCFSERPETITEIRKRFRAKHGHRNYRLTPGGEGDPEYFVSAMFRGRMFPDGFLFLA